MRDVKALLRSAVFALMALPAISGCLSTKSDSPMAESLDSLGISLRGIRESNLRLAYRDGLAVEQAADSVIMLAPDRATKVNAHLWKIYCIPVIRQIYAQSDPLLSAIDALAFSMQCREYFTTGAGKDRFGARQQIAVNAVSATEQRLIDVSRRRVTSATFDSLMSRTSRWVASHPLTNHVFERPSILNEVNDLLTGQDYSIGSAVGRIADDVDDLSGRLSLLAAQLPREARWQGEYVLADLALRERLNRLDTAIAVLTTSLASIDQGLSSGEIVVEVRSLQLLRSDLQAAMNLVSSERALVMAEIDRIRLATLAGAEEAANRAVGSWLDHAEAIVDRVLLKIGVFLAAAFAAVTLLTLSLRGVRRRQGRDG